jgi:hypothetical protein
VALGAKTPIKVPLDVGPHTIVLRQDGAEVWRHELVARASADYEFNPSMSADKLRERAQRRRRTVARTTPVEPAPAAAAPAPVPATEAPAPPTPSPAPAAVATSPARPQPEVPSPPARPATPAITTPAQPTPAPGPVTRAPAPALPKRTGPVTIPPNAVKKLGGDTPEILQHRGAEVPSVVAAKLCISHTGQVTDVSLITKLDPRVASDVRGALRTWRYTPYKHNGAPAAACFAVSFRVK